MFYHVITVMLVKFKIYLSIGIEAARYLLQTYLVKDSYTV